MNVAYLVSSLRSGGPVNQLYNIIRHLEEVTPVVIELSDRATMSERRRFKREGAKIVTLELDAKDWILWGPKRVQDLIRLYDVDLLHSHGFRSDLIASRVDYISTISTMHNYPFHDYPIRYTKPLGYAMCYAHLLFLSNIDKVVSCSNFVKDQLAKHGISSTALPNAVSTNSYYPHESIEERRRACKRAGIPFDRTIFIYIGHLTALKGVDKILTGFELAELEQDCELHIVGNGDLYRKFTEHTASNSQIVLHGYQENVIDYLHAADFYVSASKYEGLPTAVLEALATETPVGLSNIGPHKEVIDDTPSPGVLFDNTDPKSIARMFHQLQALDYNTVSDAARDRVVSRYNSKRMSREYQEIYRNRIQKS